MVDDHLIFLVTIPIYYGSNESSEKDVFGSEKSSERSSETTAISSGTGSGTHPHKVLGQAKRQRRAWGHPYIKQKHTKMGQRIFPVGRGHLIKNKVVPLQHGTYQAS